MARLCESAGGTTKRPLKTLSLGVSAQVNAQACAYRRTLVRNNAATDPQRGLLRRVSALNIFFSNWGAPNGALVDAEQRRSLRSRMTTPQG